ncbi:hypothetical protein SASPL_136669 [Salvia splendens]|uniref:Xyloglucan 6-xylosyltransferase n=1 Tax=Salvia splendens TaxID=180675 RepID=A0A8X8X111_SALSN|nr:putative glycosyltransferase 7 [Salvia splendens]KAG6404422.1 hypothetical protein SASPL_136669 [Salvia splendens]
MATINLKNLWITAASSALILILFLTLTKPWPLQSNPQSDVACNPQARVPARIQTGRESNDTSFYDDNTTTYTIDEPVIDWDQKRTLWFKLHPTFSSSENRLLVVTGSQPSPCPSRLGDHFLLRFFKNKVDYCRIHGCSVFYNNALLHPRMRSDWAMMPVVRAAMVAHPQVEWLLWVDADVIFTDMDFEIDFNKYEAHNVVVHGWPDLTLGLVLIRNCEWSMELLDVWAGLGPKMSNNRKWGEILESSFKEMIYVENNGGCRNDIVGRGLEELGGKVAELERRVAALRRRHAEAVGKGYAAERERCAEEGGWRRPFVTDFSVCGRCSEERDDVAGFCSAGMERALNFADNQVLRNYGFVHPDLGNASLVPLSSRYLKRAHFDYFI